MTTIEGGGGGGGVGVVMGDVITNPLVGINVLNKLLRLHAVKFKRTMNPSESDQWTRKLRTIFKTMMDPEEYKVGLVMHLFREEANH